MPQAKARHTVLNGQEITVYGLAVLCAFLGRSSRTVRRWEKNRIIPRPILDFGKEHGNNHLRWYTADEIKIYVLCHSKIGFVKGESIRESHFFPAIRGEIDCLRDRIEKKRPITAELDYKELKEIRALYAVPKRKRRKKDD